MTISPAHPDELAAAFHLLYGPDPANEHIAHAFQLVARGELDPADLLVARSGQRLTGAVFCQRLPGAVAVIWPPRAVGDDPAVEDALTAAALDHVAGVRVLQAFLPPEEAGRAGPLVRAGFRRVTRVWQMDRLAATRQRSAGPDAPVTVDQWQRRTAVREQAEEPPAPGTRAEPPDSSLGPLTHGRAPLTHGRAPLPTATGPCSSVPSRLTISPYPAADPAEFDRTLLRAHDDSRDCPELNGVRTPDEVLAGYRASAPDLSRWWLARLDEVPAGVLILGPRELSFVGVVPERRGRGVGRALVAAAVSWQPDLSLIVDERNEPAGALYRSLGFETVGSRDVYLRLK